MKNKTISIGASRFKRVQKAMVCLLHSQNNTAILYYINKRTDEDIFEAIRSETKHHFMYTIYNRYY